ncbi:M28 family metallopeptidase [Tundrisphaera lichenicola]|uniref:M28 family metallopeptidase n=1 Tax=Tundrisphaera lichenicola TaxID=2029860 RepID=UPI003EB73603
MHCRGISGLLGLIALITITAEAPAQEPIIGFSVGSRASQVKAEAHAMSIPTPDAARAWLREITEEPHVAGTPADYRTAVNVRDKLRSWGWTAELAEYEVLLNYPIQQPGKGVLCEIIRPNPISLKVLEEPIAADKDSASSDAFPAFHGYGVSGDVTGQVVYANYGRPEDFTALEKLGIDVKGKIVLVRYGELFRGLKVRNAQKRGAKGILIYSDPADDGYARGDVYPNGPYRPGSALQRGSVQFLSLGPGDPSTPNGPSIKGAKRLAIDPRHGFTLSEEDVVEPPSTSGGPPIVKSPSIKTWEKDSGQNRDDYYASIPSLPISYDAASPILEAMGGPNVPSGWQGGLPQPYHVGPGPVEVHFRVEMDYQIRTIWNVIATIKGEAEPDRWVMIGNHRDAWVYGAVDPGSGTAATLEMCRALGSAVKQGWKPRRTLVYASWDAEEYGLVGSTEWADHHSEEINEKALMLLNVDSAVSGPELDVDGVPSLRDLFMEAAGSIPDVRSGRTLRDVWVARRRAAWAGTAAVDLEDIWDSAATASDEPSNTPSVTRVRRFSPQLNSLGSGSDYTAFLDHLGVPSLDVGFSGRYGVYHSVYDNIYWMEKFGDPEFVTHATAARLYTLITMRAASAEVAPLKFVPYGEALRDYVDDLRRIVARKTRAIESDPLKPQITLENLGRLVGAIKGFEIQASSLDEATEALTKRESVPLPQLIRINDALSKVERSFLLAKGLPGRPWFRHSIYAPGLTTGYACWTLPGLRQAIIENDPEMIAIQIPALAERIDAATAAMKAAIEATNVEANPGVSQPSIGAKPAVPANPPGNGASTTPPQNPVGIVGGK